MRISTVIVTKDRHEVIHGCLQSLIEQSALPDEILIIDGSESAEYTLEVVKKFQNIEKRSPNIYYEHTKPGLCRQRNRGIALSKGDVVLFVDDDTVLDRDFIKNLKAAYLENPDVGGIGGLVTNITFSRLTKLFSRVFFRGIFREKLMEVTFKPLKDGDGRLILVNRIHGCAMSFKREVFGEQRFDEGLPYCGYGSDDLEFCGRVSQKHKLAVALRCKCVHHSHPGGRIAALKMLEGLLAGYFYVFARQPDRGFISLISLAWLNIGHFIKWTRVGIRYKDINFLLLYPYMHVNAVRNGIRILSRHS